MFGGTDLNKHAAAAATYMLKGVVTNNGHYESFVLVHRPILLRGIERFANSELQMIKSQELMKINS